MFEIWQGSTFLSCCFESWVCDLRSCLPKEPLPCAVHYAGSALCIMHCAVHFAGFALKLIVMQCSAIWGVGGGLSKTYARIGNHLSCAQCTTFAQYCKLWLSAHCNAQQYYENWQANPHLLTANIAHLYHYHGDEEERLWSVDKQSDGMANMRTKPLMWWWWQSELKCSEVVWCN